MHVISVRISSRDVVTGSFKAESAYTRELIAENTLTFLIKMFKIKTYSNNTIAK
jgi:hypothetical protein